ncbi:MAG: hypothetical protein QW688_00465 [Thermoprotei archaeon]
MYVGCSDAQRATSPRRRRSTAGVANVKPIVEKLRRYTTNHSPMVLSASDMLKLTHKISDLQEPKL